MISIHYLHGTKAILWNFVQKNSNCKKLTVKEFQTPNCQIVIKEPIFYSIPLESGFKKYQSTRYSMSSKNIVLIAFNETRLDKGITDSVILYN